MGFDEMDYRMKAIREAKRESTMFFYSHSRYQRRIQMRIQYLADQLGWRLPGW